MAIIEQQGAGCCGRRILSGMSDATVDSIRHDMREYLVVGDTGRDRNEMNKIVEVVTAAGTRNREGVEAALVEVGFVMVAEWDNYLTGTLCRMFLYAPDWVAFPNGAAVPIAPPPPPPPAPRPPRDPARVVHSTFHNVLRDGRSDAGWSTREAASAAAPRAASIDRRDIYASGVTRWVTGV